MLFADNLAFGHSSKLGRALASMMDACMHASCLPFIIARNQLSATKRDLFLLVCLLTYSYISILFSIVSLHPGACMGTMAGTTLSYEQQRIQNIKSVIPASTLNTN
jgi:hypothetical protein